MKAEIIRFENLLKDGKITLLGYHSGAGGSPKFSFPSTEGGLQEAIRRVADVYNNDGSPNGQSSHAEEYAITLVHLERWDEAYKMFQAVAGTDFSGPPSPKENSFDAVANQPGQLGYEGIHRYALSARKLGHPTLEKNILMKIAECTPKCFPIRMEDVMVDSLTRLVTNFKMHDLSNKLREAEAHQY
jgi:hypothetical protein